MRCSGAGRCPIRFADADPASDRPDVAAPRVVGMNWPTWREATEEALYGNGGFFRREQPADHFRTSTHASSLFAGAVRRLAVDCGARTVVDVGAGGGELLIALAACDPSLELLGVEIAAAPAGLPKQVGWTSVAPDGLVDVLVVANEWLDDVAVDVVQVDDDGVPLLVEVDPATGHERPGPLPGVPDREWLSRWWPVEHAAPGFRAEIGRSRDDAWADLVRRVRRGVLVAVDYCHSSASRPPHGTLTGYRDGRMTRPVPDGSCDITAHVALDACAAAGVAAGATATLLTSQRDALRALGVDASLPDSALATSDPVAYVAALAVSSQAAELLDRAGLGGFGWLVQTVGVGLPPSLRPLGS
jgi:Putative S-adenosyl-L-methionine-dependent methyltransferase